MLKFTRFNIMGLDVTPKEVSPLFSDLLKKHLINIKLDVREKEMVIIPDKKLLATSAVKNIIPLKPDSPKIKELGRSYLESDRLTEDQYKTFVSVMTTYFQSLGLSYTLSFQEFDNDDTSLKNIVVDGTVVGALPMPASFPVKKTA